jgi:hypothetical protein
MTFNRDHRSVSGHRNSVILKVDISIRVPDQ